MGHRQVPAAIHSPPWNRPNAWASMSDIVSRPNQNQRNESAVIIVRQCAVASSARFGGAVILQPLRSRFPRSPPRPQWIVLSQ
jgi:hypothetical protein